MRRMLLGLTAALVSSAGLAHGQDQMTPTAPASPYSAIEYGGASTSDYRGERQLTGAGQAPAQSCSPAQFSSPAQSCLGCQQQQQQQCDCGYRVKGWLAADYLMMFPQGQVVPANLFLAPNGSPLIVGQMHYAITHGVRIDAGVWLNSDETIASQALVDQLFRAYNTVTAATAIAVTAPSGGFPAGTPLTGLTFQEWIQFTRADANNWVQIASGQYERIYGIVGAKFMQLEEDLAASYTTAGANFDDFHTRNNFIGVNVGLLIQYSRGRWDADAALKCGLGENYYQTTILGRSSLGGATLFTSPVNIGYFENSVFSVVPEVNLGLGCHLTERLAVRAGYNFLAFTNVQRPASQVSQTTGGVVYSPARETFLLHGANFGAVLQY